MNKTYHEYKVKVKNTKTGRIKTSSWFAAKSKDVKKEMESTLLNIKVIATKRIW